MVNGLRMNCRWLLTEKNVEKDKTEKNVEKDKTEKNMEKDKTEKNIEKDKTERNIEKNKTEKNIENKKTEKNIENKKTKKIMKKENTEKIIQNIEIPTKKRKIENVQSTSKGISKSDHGSWYCPLCKEARLLDMIMCQQCDVWFHEDCLGIQLEDNFSLCHWCSEVNK